MIRQTRRGVPPGRLDATPHSITTCAESFQFPRGCQPASHIFPALADRVVRDFVCTQCGHWCAWRDHGGGGRGFPLCVACCWILDLFRRGDTTAALDALFGKFSVEGSRA